MTKTAEYVTWQAMIQRCTNRKSKSWKYYGGRGICVCLRWFQFENFLADMGPKPSPELTIERVNNDGNYTPENCIWATRKQQSVNARLREKARRRQNVFRPLGLPLTLEEICRIVGISQSTYKGRIRWGMHPAKALLTEVRKHKKDRYHEKNR